MNRILSFIIFFVAYVVAQGQTGVGVIEPHSSAKVEITSPDKGLLIPRVALTAVNNAAPITSPATSLLIYNTATAGTAPNNVTPGYYYWDGSKWIAMEVDAKNALLKRGNDIELGGDMTRHTVIANKGQYDFAIRKEVTGGNPATETAFIVDEDVSGAKIGIRTNAPSNTLDVNGTARIRNTPNSGSTKDIGLVVDKDGVIKKQLSDTKGIFRGYLNSNYGPGANINSIYKVNSTWIKLDDPANNFDTSTGLFTAPVAGLYKITITGTSWSSQTGSLANFIYGFASNSTNKWILRFSIPSVYILPNGDVGSASTFVGVANLAQGQKYYFGINGGQTLLAYPNGSTGSGIGTFFEIQLLSND